MKGGFTMVSVSIVRRFALALTLGITMTAAAACGGDDGGSPVSAFCERADECNNLIDGVSVDECVEMIEVDLAAATPSQQSDWETVMSGCLEFDACSSFIQCVDSNGL
jgi:hypothetical protein